MTYRQLARLAATAIWVTLVISYQAARYIRRQRQRRAQRRSFRKSWA